MDASWSPFWHREAPRRVRPGGGRGGGLGLEWKSRLHVQPVIVCRPENCLEQRSQLAFQANLLTPRKSRRRSLNSWESSDQSHILAASRLWGVPWTRTVGTSHSSLSSVEGAQLP